MANSLFEIRRRSLDELEDFREIRLEALKQAPEAFGSVYEVDSLKPMSAFAERISNSLIFAAYMEDRIVGMAGLKPETGPKDLHKGFIWGVYVRADARQYGIAAALMQHLLEAGKEIVEQLTLTVVKENLAAIRLYQKLGFTIYGTEPCSMKSNGQYVDEVLMVKFLREI